MIEESVRYQLNTITNYLKKVKPETKKPPSCPPKFAAEANLGGLGDFLLLSPTQTETVLYCAPNLRITDAAYFSFNQSTAFSLESKIPTLVSLPESFVIKYANVL